MPVIARHVCTAVVFHYVFHHVCLHVYGKKLNELLVVQPMWTWAYVTQRGGVARWLAHLTRWAQAKDRVVSLSIDI